MAEAPTELASIEVTDQPWTLPIDAIVVSVGGSFGELGSALADRFRKAPWPTEFDQITPGQPDSVRLRDRWSSGQSGPWLAVLAKPYVRGDDSPTVQSIADATAAAVRVADQAGARSIGMPMLATGVLGMDFSSVAAIAVPVALNALQNSNIRSVTFLARHQQERGILRAAMDGKLRTPTRLREEGEATDLAGGVSTDLVDPNKGIPLSKDQLGVAPYVSMLATMITDRKTPTPVSVGIFGEWGSGKSFFMGLLRNSIDELAKSRNPAYCTEIAQIGFNAWHYADSNLWASLGDEIFRQLAETGPLAEDQRCRLRAELADRLGYQQELRVEAKRAQTGAVTLQAEVDAATGSRRARAADLLGVLGQAPTFRRSLASIWRKLGVDENDRPNMLADEFNGTLSDAAALRRASTDRVGKWILLTAAMVLVTCAVITAFAPEIRAWIAGIGGGVLLTGFTTGTVLLARARSGLRALRSLSEEVRSKLNDATPEAKHALAALRAVEVERRVAETQLQDVVAHIGELNTQLSELAPGRRLYSFLASRAEDGSYQRNLGLISMIRKDFTELVKLMDDWRRHPDEGGGGRPIDRIVLYIDDLDRCSPHQVVDVLQAVHLLLALDLFIVVIGVDPRWLLRSLRSHYDNILDNANTATDADPLRMIPEDYLDKIINIPIALPAGMPAGSLNRLLAAIDGENVDGTGAVADSAIHRLNGDTGSSARADGDIGIEFGSEIDEQEAVPGVNPPRPLTGAELALLSALDVLVDTPREAKRLFNLYRMIRATRDLSDASRFLGEDRKPGEYEAVVVLLGLLTVRNPLVNVLLDAVPAMADNIAGGLLRRPPETSWDRFVADCALVKGRNRIVGSIAGESVDDWIQVNTALDRVSTLITLPDISTFQRWAPRIRRFSYAVIV